MNLEIKRNDVVVFVTACSEDDAIRFQVDIKYGVDLFAKDYFLPKGVSYPTDYTIIEFLNKHAMKVVEASTTDSKKREYLWELWYK